MRERQSVQVDERGRTYLSKLGYAKGSMVVAEPLEGEENAWVLRPGRIVTDVELALLNNPRNVESLQRAAAESLAGEQGTDLV
jgi:hypothetical protein